MNAYLHALLKRKVFANVLMGVFLAGGLLSAMNIRQEFGHSALEIIRIEPPESLSRALNPFSVRVCRPEPEAERLIVFTVCQEIFKTYQ